MTNFTFIIDTILAKNFDLEQRRLRFLSHCLGLFLRILGRLNFLQLARYSGTSYVESSYRNHFEQYFDFATFNTALVLDLDAHFSKKSFMLPLVEKTNFERIGRLRKDAHLRYLYQGKATGKKGKPQKICR